ncbi:hypothetical protein MNBD_ALPHA06-352 [hydrothermal vent metagenome]|uniref:HTH tetR-type domain-containing protein n=1 Tax=hydrothermal vent metagenome TaxID=652676 RepID=A0A3B0R848_9ZZZZ
MAGRPRKFDREQAIDRFLQLFWQNGFADTSIDDLQSAAGIQRGSFYAAFKDKETSYLLSLERYADQFAEQAKAAMYSQTSPRAGLAAFFRFAGDFLANNTGRGCFLLSSIATNPPLNAANMQFFERITQALRGPLQQTCERVKTMGELTDKETAHSLGAYALTQVLGLNALTRSGANPKTIRAVAQLAAANMQN